MRIWKSFFLVACLALAAGSLSACYGPYGGYGPGWHHDHGGGGPDGWDGGHGGPGRY